VKSNTKQELIANAIVNSLDIMPHAGKVEAKHVRVTGQMTSDYIKLSTHSMHDLIDELDNVVLDEAYDHLIDGLRDDDEFVDAHCAALRLGMALMNEARITAEQNIKAMVVSAVNQQRKFF
jgi:hypothetical protein